MTITYTDSQVASISGAGGPIALAAFAADDIVVVAVHLQDVTNSPTVSSMSDNSGQGLVYQKKAQKQWAAGGVHFDMEIWWARATGAHVSPSVTVNLSASAAAGRLIAFRAQGCVTSQDPWDPNASMPAYNTGTSSTGATSPAVNTTTIDTMVLAMVSCDTDPNTFAGQAGWSSVNTGTNFFSFLTNVQEKTFAATQAGLTASWTWTSPNVNFATMTVALTADTYTSRLNQPVINVVL